MSSIWTVGMTLDDSEKIIIQKAMAFFHGNKTQVARSLGIAIRTLDNKLKKIEGDPNEHNEKTESD